MLRCVIGLLISGIGAHAAAPSLDCLYPVAAQLGATNAVNAVGKFDPWPPKVWTSAATVSLVAETNKGKLRIIVHPDTKPGPYFVRVYNEQGASAPRFIYITHNPEPVEEEPNNDFQAAQKVETIPATVNARFDKSDDVDTYRLDLANGQTIAASVEAYLLASPVDAVLRLVDARGVEVAFNHDDGRTLDPEIIYTAPRAESYFLQAFGFNYPADSNIRFIGNDKCVYRLRVWSPTTDESFVRCQNETEPNDTTNNATAIAVPGVISGCIESSEDEDLFQFKAKKGDKLLLKVESARFGFPLDARLGIKNGKQEEVAQADDSATADPMLDWSPGDDGTFFASVRNVLHRGGTNYRYRLSIEKPAPTLKATVSDHRFTIAPGKTNKIAVTLKRQHGFEGKISLTAKGLPEGVQCEPGENAISLIALGDAKPFSGPFRIIATDTETTYPVVHELISAGEDNGVPNGFSRLLIDATEHLWLTVTAP